MISSRMSQEEQQMFEEYKENRNEIIQLLAACRKMGYGKVILHFSDSRLRQIERDEIVWKA